LFRYSAEDVDRLIDEGGVEAIICLQCTLCHGGDVYKLTQRLKARLVSTLEPESAWFEPLNLKALGFTTLVRDSAIVSTLEPET
jgi:hypothetical protein